MHDYTEKIADRAYTFQKVGSLNLWGPIRRNSVSTPKSCPDLVPLPHYKGESQR